uniref:Ig-like domain-containing protein n=1 Tax=Sander lucioperca TaxID=283035 RepID=A0A8D0DHM0_SANLU
MTGIQYLACLWTLFITQTGFVCSDIQFLERNEGESVVLPCVVDQRNPSPFGVYLKRNWLKTSEVLFMHTGNDVSADNRISVSGDPSSHSLNVTISQLSASDTDRYYCEFVANNPLGEDDRKQGKTEFFLLVNSGGQCGCSNYSTLLYALSSAVAILLLILGFVVIYKGKAHRSVKSHPQAPIYEEMTGLQPVSRKLAPRHLEETESSEYRNCSVKKSYTENHYESPIGALSPRSES